MARCCVRFEPTISEREALLDAYYYPHHDALTRAVETALQTFGSCVIIDCHSFPSLAPSYELDKSAQRPEICVGTDEFHTPDWLVALCVRAFRDEGYSTAINSPYVGRLVPSAHFRSDQPVSPIMIEMNRRVDMDEVSGERLAKFTTHRDAVHSALSAVRATLSPKSH